MQHISNTQRVFFLHLSDIHFSRLDGDVVVFDAYAKIRHELEIDCDIIRKDKRWDNFEGIIVTGDVAFSGDSGEYATAYNWLKKLCEIVHCQSENVWVIPGNHDVYRTALEDPVNEAIHDRLRAAPANEFDDLVQKYMRNEGGKKSMYAPLRPYLEFAKLFECIPDQDQLYWEEDIVLNDCSVLRIRGLNSALVCDASDDEDPFKMVLGEIQCLAPRDPGVVYMYLTHHPPQWLKDDDEVEDHFKNHAAIQLMGHKHRQRIGIIYDCLRLSAGAVNPDKREPDWTPRYNILAVSVEGVGNCRRLRIDVYPRVWKAADEKFTADRNDKGSDEHSYYINLPAWARPEDKDLPLETAIVPDSLGEEFAAVAESSQSSKNLPGKEFAVNLHRRITYRFLSLPHRIRLGIAIKLNLVRDEDEGVDDAELIRRVFRRARENGVLPALIQEVDSQYISNG
jgi:calcineurin-like phosphoesterase family protein